MVRPLAGCLLVLAACSTQEKRATMAPSTSPPANIASSSGRNPVSAMPGDPKEEIARLYDQIEKERDELKLPLPAPAAEGTAAEPMATVPLSTDATCRPAKTDRCTQSCTFSDSICTNADKICNIAAQVPQDTWAAGKCTQAKQTCESAHETCCTCA